MCVDFFVLDQECASTFVIKEERKPVFIQWFDFYFSVGRFYCQINGTEKHYTSEWEDRRNKIRHKVNWNWNCMAKKSKNSILFWYLRQMIFNLMSQFLLSAATATVAAAAVIRNISFHVSLHFGGIEIDKICWIFVHSPRRRRRWSYRFVNWPLARIVNAFQMTQSKMWRK